jgi:uncharacterized cupin superfamily protein
MSLKREAGYRTAARSVPRPACGERERGEEMINRASRKPGEMRRRLGGLLSSAPIALLLHCVAWAQAPEVVPIEKEPRHQLVLTTPFARVFDAKIPAGDVSLFHTHLQDSVFICIDGAETLSEEPDKPVVKRPPFKSGDVWYRAHTQTPLTHRVNNVGTSNFRVLDIEAIRPPVEGDLPKLPTVYQTVLDNNRVRVSRFTLQPGEDTGFINFNRSGLLIVLKPSRLTIDRKPNHTLFDPDPGDLSERIKAGEQRVVNSGKSVFEGFEVEFK